MKNTVSKILILAEQPTHTYHTRPLCYDIDNDKNKNTLGCNGTQKSWFRKYLGF